MANTTTSKVTIADNFATVKAFLIENGADESLVAFIQDRADKAVRKSTSERKPTARQIENATLTNAIYEYMLDKEPMQVSEMIKVIPALEGLNTQRVTPMVSKDARFRKVANGKLSLYGVATDTE